MQAASDTLARRDQWVAWRYEDTGRDKPTKPPYSPGTLKRASVRDPATWGSYTDALSASLDGVGFVFTEDDPYVVIDLDDCLDEFGIIVHPSVDDVIDSFDSYAEVSPSGRGLRIIVEGKWHGRNQVQGAWGGNFEIYDSERYGTFTGESYGRPKPIRDGQAGLDYWAPRFGFSGVRETRSCLPKPTERKPNSEVPDWVQAILAEEWPIGIRSDKMIEAENGMSYLPAEERYLHLRTNASFCAKMDDRGGSLKGWDFYVSYIRASAYAKVDLDRRFTERKGGTAPRTPRELLEGRRHAAILLDHELQHPDADHHTHAMLVDTYQQALKHGDLRSAATNPRDDVAIRHWLTQDGHHKFLHRSYHPKYAVKSIGHQGCKTVVNLLTPRAEQIIACHNRHHVDEEAHQAPNTCSVGEVRHVEDTPMSAWNRLLSDQRWAKRHKHWRLLKHYNNCINACLPQGAIRAATWNSTRKDRTPLGTSNDFQNARYRWVRISRTNAYDVIVLPSLETFLAWEEEADEVDALTSYKLIPRQGVRRPFPAWSPGERLRELEQVMAGRSKANHPTPCGLINRSSSLPDPLSTWETEPQRGPPDAFLRFQELKLKYKTCDEPGREKESRAEAEECCVV